MQTQGTLAIGLGLAIVWIASNGFGTVRAAADDSDDVRVSGAQVVSDDSPIVVGAPISDEVIKRLVSRAAGMSRDTFREILNTGGRADEVSGGAVSTPLSVWLMDAVAETQSTDDFKVLEPIDPVELAKVLEAGSVQNVRSAYASFIRPQYIVDLQCEYEDGVIFGLIEYAVEGMYEGRVDFVIIKRDDNWVVAELALPVSERLFILDDAGRWQMREP